MYSQRLQEFVEEISRIGEVDPQNVNLLNESLSCYLSALAKIINGELNPPADLLSTSLDLLSLSIALTEADFEADGSHYLVAMGLEQSGELLARHYMGNAAQVVPPLNNDYWYRLALALLHYLAGGYRVQALSIANRLDWIAYQAQGGNFQREYRFAARALRALVTGKLRTRLITDIERFLLVDEEPVSEYGKSLHHLAQKIRQRRRIALSDLGEGNEQEWLEARNIVDKDATSFWHDYLSRLDYRGITSFTSEQIGPGFDVWLRTDVDLLVILPTGSGKSVIGELRTALTLAEKKQVVWILPTRSLVRQVKRELNFAYRRMGVFVEELPTTEDFHPLFTDAVEEKRAVSATTPEKLLALIRSNEKSITDVGLVVLDEAQILFDLKRGSTIEFVLQEIQRILPECQIILMSAYLDTVNRFRNFMKRLRGNYVELLSDARPTRRIYGVVTDQSVDGQNFATIQVFPPGLQTDQAQDGEEPYSILLRNQKIRGRFGPTDLAQKLVLSLSQTDIRSVMFVGTVPSTEKQATDIAGAVEEAISLPDEDLSRLRVELGRDSVVHLTGIKKVAPHHAGLSRLEQHIVEKWANKGTINSVIATPTLAQGVNLPFDISVLSFVTRNNPETKQNDPVPQSEILNMLGRAGRAGRVSDGLCLIAMKSLTDSPRDTLNSARKHFFRVVEPAQEFLGLSRLMAIATNSHIQEKDWLFELSSMEFSQIQTLISFVLNTVKEVGIDDINVALAERLQKYPSVQDLSELFGQGVDIIGLLNSHLVPMANNLINQCDGDQILQGAVSKTGMPIEVLRGFIKVLQEDYVPEGKTSEELTEWSDNIVRQTLDQFKGREWFINLMQGRDFDQMLQAISLWRSGAPMVNIEQSWQLRPLENRNRIEVGRFFNHGISMFAQFWGALSICEELIYGDQENLPLRYIQTCVREGVNSLVELEWLHKLGNIDRVLAHRLAQVLPDLEGSKRIQQQLETWRLERIAIPTELTPDEVGALVSILDE